MNIPREEKTVFGTNSLYNYKFQEQELQETGFYSFKWRQYMPDVGRFFNIDPLSEKYAYQSHYNFSENRVIDGRELEGLEWVSSRNLEEKTVNLHLTYKLTNNTINALTNDQLKTLVTERQNAINTFVGGKTSEGYNLSFSFTQSETATIVWDYNMGFDITNVVDLNKAPKSDIEFALTTALGMTDIIGNTQINRTQISVGKSEHFLWNKDGQIEFDKDDRSTIAQTGVHETLHELGLGHLDKETLKDPKNIVQAHPTGTVVTPQQRSTIINNVEQQQKNK
jgi:RHS repeat-associated protein